MKETKQVIVIRKDLKIRRGKEMAQAAHASMSFLTKHLNGIPTDKSMPYVSTFITKAQEEWLLSSFRKIVCYVESEQELLDLHKKAQDLGLESYLITDAGYTEFNEPTNTCIAIGPDYSENIDKVTSDLRLY